MPMGKRALHAAALAAVLLANPWGCDDRDPLNADREPSDVASAWFEQLYDVVKAEKTAPPPASRIYALAAVALYEAVVPGSESRRSLAGQLAGLDTVPAPFGGSHHWPTAANAALAEAIRGLYPTASPASLSAIEALEQQLAAQMQTQAPEPVRARSAAYGKAVAAAILDWADSDGSAAACAYTPAAVAGAWRATPPSFTPNPAFPCWGKLRPMVLASAAECAAPGHPAFSVDPASAFRAAALEVYEAGLALTDEQKTIADYWADGAGATGTPPGHWIAIVSQLARSDDLSLAAAAEAYARVGIAVHDAFIQCWATKYATNLQRPVSYINDHVDAAWLPYIVTPAFPTYTSGHSTQSGAATRVLTDLFGVRSFTDTTHADHGLVPPQAPRSFASFEAAGAEAAVSRLYGGIHYAFDNDDGLVAGKCIGDAIVDRVEFRRP